MNEKREREGGREEERDKGSQDLSALRCRPLAAVVVRGTMAPVGRADADAVRRLVFVRLYAQTRSCSSFRFQQLNDNK